MKHLVIAALLVIALNYTTKNERDETDKIRAWFYQMYLQAKAKPLDAQGQRVKYRMYDMLCFELRDVDCTGITAPKVEKFEPNPFRPGLAGYYQGGDTIYVRSNLKSKEMEEVLAHEMSHYLDVELDLANVPGFAREICFSEKRAWAVSDAYWTKYGYKNKVVGSSWTNWYSHCTPLQSELYPDEYPAEPCPEPETERECLAPVNEEE